MKTTSEMKLLKGQTESITITEFRQRPGEVFQQDGKDIHHYTQWKNNRRNTPTRT